MKRRQATAEDFKRGQYIWDMEGNEFIIKDKYHEGIYETNRGRALFTCEAKFYTVEDK